MKEAFISPTAVVLKSRLDPNVVISDGARVGPYCVIKSTPEKRTYIGDNAVLGPFVNVSPGVVVGCRAQVLAGSIVRRDVPPNSMLKNAVKPRNLKK